jgi:hypothetical protein
MVFSFFAALQLCFGPLPALRNVQSFAPRAESSHGGFCEIRRCGTAGD